jgi:hypothetical protein
MRQIFSIRSFLLFCIFGFYLFPSCTSSKKGVIYIVSGDTTTGKLKLVDANHQSAYEFKVQPGEKIKWRINFDSTSTVRALDSFPLEINKTPNGILEKRPHKKFLSSAWVGKVRTVNVKSGDDEYYYIHWKGVDGKDHQFDPRIIINP